MAYAYSWPASLPQAPQKGFTEMGGPRIVRAQMDAGIAKQRYRGLGPSALNVSFIMTTEQVEVFESFVLSTLRGVARFGFTHPRTGAVVEVRIIPQGESLYSLNYIAPGYYTINLQLEVLP